MAVNKNRRMWKQVQERDGGMCAACGTNYGLTLQHRAGKGMGGSNSAECFSNYLVLCGLHNGLLEDDGEFARKGRAYGWKCSRNQVTTPADIAVWYVMEQAWFLLEDDGSRLRVPEWWQEELTREAQEQLQAA